MLEGPQASLSGTGSALKVQSGLPHFVYLNDDPLATEVIIYALKEVYVFFMRSKRG